MCTRLSAYSGVMAARVYQAQQDENRGAGPASGRFAGTASAAPVNDPRLVDKMVADGWIEHNVERA